MINVVEFLAPRMVGPRFERHAIPLDLLKELAVLEDMIVEVAKWCYLQDNPNRQRIPKRFTDGISLNLCEIRTGCAIPVLSLIVDQQNLFPPDNQIYLERARDQVISAINAAEYDEIITDYIPDALLAYFDRIGRGLRDGESIEFAPKASTRKARLTKGTRRKLLLASSKIDEVTEEVILRGSIPEVNQGKMTFELQVINGPRVVGPIESQHLSTILEAFNDYKQGARVILHGIGRYSRFDRLQSLESIEHVSLLDPNDAVARLEEFKTIRDGWLDGRRGFSLDKYGLSWLADKFQANFPDELPPPYLYPTPEGGVQAEWSFANIEISLEIDLYGHKGEWQALDLISQIEMEKQLELDEKESWSWIAEEIQKYLNDEIQGLLDKGGAA